MTRYVVLGNSGSGKSTLAMRLANLDMLVNWIRDYATRRDAFSWAAHRALFDGFAGEKNELTSREAIAAFSVLSPSSRGASET